MPEWLIIGVLIIGALAIAFLAWLGYRQGYREELKRQGYETGIRHHRTP